MRNKTADDKDNQVNHGKKHTFYAFCEEITEGSLSERLIPDSRKSNEI